MQGIKSPHSPLWTENVQLTGVILSGVRTPKTPSEHGPQVLGFTQPLLLGLEILYIGPGPGQYEPCLAAVSTVSECFNVYCIMWP